MLTVFVALVTTVVSVLSTVLSTIQRRLPRPSDRERDSGQATAEYALVLLGAATVALLLVAWAARSGKVAQLLDAVLDKVLGQI
jgi:hypothetical protein